MANGNLFRNLFKRGIFLAFPVFMLTACTARNDLVLESDGQETAYATEALSEETTDIRGIAAAEAVISTESGGMPGGGMQNGGAQEDNPSTEIYVHICGAVANPGVYVLQSGSRLFEGVEAAGGFREDACEDFINQAVPLQDGQRIAIPTMEEAEAAKAYGTYQEQWLSEAADVGAAGQSTGAEGAGSTASGNAGGLVNINTATEQELSNISGIGAGKAAAIVQYRQENGSFTSIEDIMKVSGIKEGTFEKIKDKITVN